MDGDTPYADRRGIMASAQVILTNPDMLHVTILPRHKEFAGLLTNLKPAWTRAALPFLRLCVI